MDLKEIKTEISKLENAETTYSNCDKLATLYTVKNGLEPQKPSTQNVVSCSYASAPRSEFIEAFMAAPEDDALQVLDKHMDIIKLLYPKEYDVILNKLFSMVL